MSTVPDAIAFMILLRRDSPMSLRRTPVLRQ
jgi:hypothetical protein